MRPVKIKWNLALPVAFVGAVIVYIFFDYISVTIYNWTDLLQSTRCTTEYLGHPEMQNLLKYCNSLEENTKDAKDGDVDMDFYKLELVQVLIRHGDRAPLHSLPNYQFSSTNMACTTHGELAKKAPYYSQFRDTLGQVNTKRSAGQDFSGWDLFPDKLACTTSMLTPEGAAQHIENGQLMQQRYIQRWKLLEKKPKWEQIKVISTEKSRTFQSAIAFMYGFQPDIRPQQVQMEKSSNNKMCTKSTQFSCVCNSVKKYSDVMSVNFHQNLPKFVSKKKVSKAYEKIAAIMGATTKDLPRTSQIMDVAMIHACHGLPTPGLNGKCIPPRSFLDLYNSLRENGKANQKDNDFKRISRLKMLPFINDIFNKMAGIADSTTKEKFILYSGHDTTLEPLLSTLGIAEGEWPPYASRLAFETYSFDHGGHNHYLFRVVFNGVDVTSRLPFCNDKDGVLNDDGMCPVDQFATFVKDKSLDDIDKTKKKKVPTATLR